MRGFGSLIAIVTTCAFAIGVSACQPDAATIEKSIKDELEGKKVKVKSVTCPKDHKTGKGEKFTCDGETASGTKFVINVTNEDIGKIKWELVGRIMDPAEIEKEIASKGQDGFKCGDEVVIVTKGSTFECKKDDTKIKLTFKDDEGNADTAIE